MTNLKDLINSDSDDDQDLPPPFSSHHKPAKRSSHLETVLSPSSHASPTTNAPILNTSFTPFNARPAHSTRPANSSSAPEPRQASSSGGIDVERRPSNTSVDSSEPPYASTTSSSTMRSSASTATLQAPVKLTPITRRISKAKKGVPVHTCDECTKTFTRAEHLRRHQRSHRPPDLRCHVAGCNKSFHRKDLLERHQAKHEQADASSRESTQADSRHHKNSGQNFRSAPLESVLQRPQGFGETGASTAPPSQRSILNPNPWKPSTSTPSSSQQPTASPEPADSGEDCPMTDVESNYTTTPILGTSETHCPREYSQPRQVPPHLEISCGTSMDYSGVPSPGSDSPYSTPTDDVPDHYSQFPPIGTDMSWPVSMQQSSIQPPAIEFQSLSMEANYQISPSIFPPTIDRLDHPLRHDANRPFSHLPRSLTPPMAMAQPSEAMLSVPLAMTIPPAQTMDVYTCGPPPPPIFSSPIRPVLTDLVRGAIPGYLNVYWQQIDPQTPIIHRSTLPDPPELPEDLDALQCAMAALATQHLNEEKDRIMGDQLHVYASHKCKVMNNKTRGRCLAIEQAQVLCDFYARFRGMKRDSYRASNSFISLYQRVKETVFRTRKAPLGWKEWVRIESYRRLLAACFLLDIHCSHYHGQPHTKILGLDYSSPTNLRVPLSASTAESWNAQGEADWRKLHPMQEPRLLVVYPLNWESQRPSDIPSMSPFDTSILLAASSLQLQHLSQSQIGMADAMGMIHPTALQIAQLFSDSAVANTYLALRYTPLASLLSVSGNSWLFNEKITDPKRYAAQRDEISVWGGSRRASIATLFAARALRAFLHLRPVSDSTNEQERQEARVVWRDISDYWGVYVCALICWGFGNRGQQNRTAEAETPSHDESTKWILEASEMDFEGLHGWDRRLEGHGVVGIAHKVLDRDCLGGKNMLFRGAVRVLKRLVQED